MGTRATINLPRLSPSVYNLTWQTVSSDDLHATSGSMVFGLQQAITTPNQAPKTAPPQPGEALLRWLVLAGIPALAGGLAFLFLLLILGLSARDQVLQRAVPGSDHRF